MTRITRMGRDAPGRRGGTAEDAEERGGGRKWIARGRTDAKGEGGWMQMRLARRREGAEAKRTELRRRVACGREVNRAVLSSVLEPGHQRHVVSPAARRSRLTFDM